MEQFGSYIAFLVEMDWQNHLKEYMMRQIQTMNIIIAGTMACMLLAVSNGAAQIENCPTSLKVLGNSPNGSKLVARFTGEVTPSFVQVQGTTDIAPVRAGKGESAPLWVSGETYASPGVSLTIFNENMVPIAQCDYDVEGNLILPADCVADFILFTVTPKSPTVVALEWGVDPEIGVDAYEMQRAADALNFHVIALVPGQSIGFYTFDDVSPLPGASFYRIVAVCESGELFTSDIKQITRP